MPIAVLSRGHDVETAIASGKRGGLRAGGRRAQGAMPAGELAVEAVTSPMDGRGTCNRHGPYLPHEKHVPAAIGNGHGIDFILLVAGRGDMPLKAPDPAVGYTPIDLVCAT